MSSHAADKHSVWLKAKAQEMGFAFCGISRAGFLEEEAPRLEQWLASGYAGEMAYLHNHFDKRLDPTLLVPGAKSVVSLGYNYYPKEDLTNRTGYKVAKYAYGADYHHVIKAKLRQLMEALQEEVGAVEGRAFVDSAPVMERQWAARSGQGWIGKNSLLLNRQMGSFFFLAELIIDLELSPDPPMGDFCGTCTACIDACPTDAIPQAGVVDGSRCISYLTIELKNEIPARFSGQMEDWVFGCDICQDVCPWNRFAAPHRELAFEPHPDLGKMEKEAWHELTEDVFRELFRKSAVKRTRYEGLKRNIAFAKKGADTGA